jgi:membrane-bound lytic murein transglycosylase B
VVGPGQRGDARQTTELEVATVEFDEGVSRGDEAGPRRTRDRRRGPRLLLPVLVFAALLATGLVIGRYVIPAGGAQSGPEKAQPGAPGVGAETPSPTLPSLPTPPTRPADALAAWAYKISQVVAVPVVAAQAYGYAQLELQRTDSACHLSWTTLAGIGEIGSRHGQAGGAVLEQGGRSSPAIVGPLLDGKAGRAVVRDTDAGAFDGDATFDRAMGPLRLMPALWRAFAIDADGDGIVDPYDIDDASLALARMLCSGTENLTERAGWMAAVDRYHDGAAYSRSVFQVADNYGQRTRNIV